MNRRNRIALGVVAVTSALGAWALAGAAPHEPDARRDAAAEFAATRSALAHCIQRALPGLDDHLSSSESVARAALKSCTREFTDMVQAVARLYAPSCGGGSDCTQGALANAERGSTQVAIDEVNTERIRLAGAQVLICQ